MSIIYYYNKINDKLAYRIYEEGNKLVIVIMAGTRENFWEALKKYIKL